MAQHLADDAEEPSAQCDECSGGAPAASMMFAFSLPKPWSLATTKSSRPERSRRFSEINGVTGRNGHFLIGDALSFRDLCLRRRSRSAKLLG
jgi:hypothetical protein